MNFCHHVRRARRCCAAALLLPTPHASAAAMPVALRRLSPSLLAVMLLLLLFLLAVHLLLPLCAWRLVLLRLLRLAVVLVLFVLLVLSVLLVLLVLLVLCDVFAALSVLALALVLSALLPSAICAVLCCSLLFGCVVWAVAGGAARAARADRLAVCALAPCAAHHHLRQGCGLAVLGRRSGLWCPSASGGGLTGLRPLRAPATDVLLPPFVLHPPRGLHCLPL